MKEKKHEDQNETVQIENLALWANELVPSVQLNWI